MRFQRRRVSGRRYRSEMKNFIDGNMIMRRDLGAIYLRAKEEDEEDMDNEEAQEELEDIEEEEKKRAIEDDEEEDDTEEDDVEDSEMDDEEVEDEEMMDEEDEEPVDDESSEEEVDDEEMDDEDLEEEPEEDEEEERALEDEEEEDPEEADPEEEDDVVEEEEEEDEEEPEPEMDEEPTGKGRVWEGIISTNGLDSHNSIVHPEGADFTRFKNNPVIYYDHGYLNMPPDLPIGRALSIDVQEDRIVAKFELSKKTAKAQEVAALLDEGILRGLSVGFVPTDIEFEEVPTEDPKGKQATQEIMHILKWELLEFSIAGIPSNPTTLIKGKRKQVDGNVRRYTSQRAEAKALVARILDLKRKGVSKAVLRQATLPIVRNIHDVKAIEAAIDDSAALHRLIDMCECAQGHTKDVLTAALAVALSE